MYPLCCIRSLILSKFLIITPGLLYGISMSAPSPHNRTPTLSFASSCESVLLLVIKISWYCVSNSTDSRTEPNLDDLNRAFQDIGIYLPELEDFVSQVDQVPFIHQLPRYPKPKACVLHHPRNGEIAERLEQYYDYLPPLVSKLLQNEGFV